LTFSAWAAKGAKATATRAANAILGIAFMLEPPVEWRPEGDRLRPEVITI